MRLHRAQYCYFVEDDHLHLPGQKEWIREGLKYYDFVSMYDHPDKYSESFYPDLLRSIKLTSLGHFASTPSTVMTFSCKFKTLFQVYSIFVDNKFTSVKLSCPRDHALFLEIQRFGYTLGAPIPGRSTHCHKDYLSPCVDWLAYLKSL